MYQGETVTVEISNFPVDVALIKNIRIAYMMQKTVCLALTENDCYINLNTGKVSFTLTQEQSLKLKSGTVSRHVVIVTKDGKRFESKIEDELVKYTAIPEEI